MKSSKYNWLFPLFQKKIFNCDLSCFTLGSWNRRSTCSHLPVCFK